MLENVVSSHKFTKADSKYKNRYLIEYLVVIKACYYL